MVFKPIEIEVGVRNLTIHDSNKFPSNEVNEGFLPRIIRSIRAKIDMPPPNVNKAVQMSKTGVSVANKKDLCPPKIF